MNPVTTSALAHPNIALIKYWGNRDHLLRLPANGSLSINLDGLSTQTTVHFDPTLEQDVLDLNGRPAPEPALRRISGFLDLLRTLGGRVEYAKVTSHNNFPAGTGIASSASAFAALAIAASHALGLDLNEKDLSRLARRGSGSACRSIPGGFVEWQAGIGDEDSYAFSIAPASHWRLVDCIAIVSHDHKTTGSQEGHILASSSPLQAARIADTPRRLDMCRSAIQTHDFDALAAVTELDSNLMHAVILTSSPPLIYWHPGTLAVMQAVTSWRKSGLPAAYTIDAGPNVHVICQSQQAPVLAERLKNIPGVIEVRTAGIGGAARLLNTG